MTYQEFPFKASYETGIDDLIQDFYIPVLENCVAYDRIAGFFSSSSLAVAARGIAGLIRNGGKMRMLASPRLSAEDIEVITASIEDSEHYIEQKLMLELDTIKDEFEREHVQALGWMLANGYLELRLVRVNGPATYEALFHQKVGILTDQEGNRISFSGSINESATGWIHNVEEFKVFREWLPGQEEYFRTDAGRFSAFWKGERPYTTVTELPEAVAKRLMEHGQEFDLERLVLQRYLHSSQKKTVEDMLALFPYQRDAVEQWVANGYSLLFEMATGTGKTRTALGCIARAMQREERLVVIVACPQVNLARQWQKNEVEPAGFVFDKVLLADGHTGWKRELPQVLKQISVGLYQRAVVYTTHATCSSKDFTEMMECCDPSIPICFIGDEVHGLGASQTKQALLSRYRYRIGLSATPRRWFDDFGTRVLSAYFGDNSYEFNIERALREYNPLTGRHFLVNYQYHPVFITLGEDELEHYQELSAKLARLCCRGDDDDRQARYEQLLFQRADIQKNARNKLPKLLEVLDRLDTVEHTLIFVSGEQLDQVMHMLTGRGVRAHRFTEKQGTRTQDIYGGRSEREYLIDHFKSGDYQVLVAINCLNEGVDIPNANQAILMSSSTNPREYIQRIGRVIRQAPGKRDAHIYDFLVEPDFGADLAPELKLLEAKIFEKELVRACDMTGSALNNADIQRELDEKLWEVKRYVAEHDNSQ